LTFIAPILTGFSGAIFLKEPLSLKELFSGFCSFLGVVLIAKPQSLFGTSSVSEVVTPNKRMLSVIAALLGVLGATGTYTVTRAIGKRAHPLHCLTYHALVCVLASTIGMVIFQITPVIPKHALVWLLTLLISILGLIAQTLLAMGLQRETASRSVLAVYTSIVFAVIFEFIVYRTTPSTLSIAGTAIIMSSAIYISLTKKSTPKSTTGSTRERPPPTQPGHDSDPES